MEYHFLVEERRPPIICTRWFKKHTEPPQDDTWEEWAMYYPNVPQSSKAITRTMIDVIIITFHSAFKWFSMGRKGGVHFRATRAEIDKKLN